MILTTTDNVAGKNCETIGLVKGSTVQTVNAFRDMGLECFEPYGAFYVFPSIRRTGMSSEEFCARLLQEKNIAAVPGNAFGSSGEGNIRCCYATAIEKINTALERMADFVSLHS